MQGERGHTIRRFCSWGFCTLILGTSLLPASWASPIQANTDTYQERINPTDGSYERGVRLFRTGDYYRAIAIFRKATEVDPTDSNARFYLAESLAKIGRRAEALTELEKSLSYGSDAATTRRSVNKIVELKRSETPVGQRWFKVGETIAGGSQDRYIGSPGEGASFLRSISGVNGYVRWSLTRPIRLYVEEIPSGIRNFQPGFPKQVRLALDQWTAALGNQLSYTTVTVPEQSDIKVTWTNALDTRGHTGGDGTTAYTAGLTVPVIRNNRLQQVEVTLATFDIAGKPQHIEVIYAVALHELGHALGMLGHSDNPADVMNARNQSVKTLSINDIRTIRDLYSQIADLDNRSPQEREAKPHREEDLFERVDETIARYENYRKANDSALANLNLGISYFQKARLTEEKAGTRNSEAKSWYAKSLSAIDHALELEPNDARAYHKRSLVHQAMDNFEAALDDIRKAIANNRHEAEYYMLQAWYLAQLGKRAEAEDSLHTYLLYKPNEANSAEVKKIRGALGTK